jgi:hypothetical protein
LEDHARWKVGVRSTKEGKLRIVGRSRCHSSAPVMGLIRAA